MAVVWRCMQRWSAFWAQVCNLSMHLLWMASDPSLLSPKGVFNSHIAESLFHYWISFCLMWSLCLQFEATENSSAFTHELVSTANESRWMLQYQSWNLMWGTESVLSYLPRVGHTKREDFAHRCAWLCIHDSWSYLRHHTLLIVETRTLSRRN